MESSATGRAPGPVDYGPYAAGGALHPRKPSGGGSQPAYPGPAPDALASGPARETDTVRVLVVDDQPDVLATTVELFKLMGYEVFSASNGDEAMEILESTPNIQVLFSDVVMPGMNGFKLGKEARRLIPGINVILASGYQGEAVGGAGGSRDDFHFLVKPFRMADVARMLRK